LTTSGGSSGSGATDRPTPTNRGGTTQRGGVTAPKSKKPSNPWVDEIHISWNVGFLPAVGSTGYGTRLGTVADALRLPVRQGGWDRDDRPVMVLTYDAADADQRRVIESFDADNRVRAAAQYFNCFRVDVGAKARKGEAKDARLSVYTSDGTLVGEVSGQRRISGVYDLLETAWTKKGGTDFAARVAHMDALLKVKAHSEHYIPLHETGIVCPDCGGERHDILEKIAAMKARADACDRMMADLRVVARK
jgi:hypothetical protein